MRTNALRKSIKSMLSTITPKVYYEQADSDAIYPHIVFSMASVDLGYINRGDYAMEVDVWTKSIIDAEDIADAVVDLFNDINSPQSENLPTFFVDGKFTVIDDDKSIKHKQIRITIQNYERV